MKKGIILTMSALSAVILGFGAWAYVHNYDHGTDTFAEGTYINEVDCSGLTSDETQESLSVDRNNMTVTVTEDDKTLTEVKDLNLTFDIADDVNYFLHESIARMYIPIVTEHNKNIYLDMNVASIPEDSVKKLRGYKFLQNNYSVKTADAYVDLDKKSFPIVEEVYGDNVDPAKFEDAILDCYKFGNEELEYDEEDFYATPTVLSDDEDLLAYQENCKKYLGQKITYKLYNGNVTLTPKELVSMMEFSGTSMRVNQDGVDAFVKAFAQKYNTVGSTRSFTTSTGSVVTVKGGNYGYSIDTATEAQELASDIRSKKNVTREPNYSQKGYSTGANGDIGSSYAEVNLSTQKAFLYKGGSLIISTDVVTGNVAQGKATPSGVFKIAYKDRNVTLRGQDYDGSQYESPVSYWMPFTGGIGFHDASWRTEFGKEIYRTNGSHGCVNMPPSAAATFYNNVSAGYPVVVHY